MVYEDEIKEVVSKVMECEKTDIEIDEETELIGGEMGISSMDYVEILVGIEESVDVVFDFSSKIETVGDLVRYIEKEKNNNA